MDYIFSKLGQRSFPFGIRLGTFEFPECIRLRFDGTFYQLEIRVPHGKTHRDSGFIETVLVDLRGQIISDKIEYNQARHFDTIDDLYKEMVRVHDALKTPPRRRRRRSRRR